MHNEPHPTNTETVRTTSSIALGPTPDLDGPWEFLSLQSGRKVVRRAWTQLPITADVIRCTHELADVDDDANPDAFLHEFRPNVHILDLLEDQLDLALRAPPGGAGDVPDDNAPAAAPPSKTIHTTTTTTKTPPKMRRMKKATALIVIIVALLVTVVLVVMMNRMMIVMMINHQRPSTMQGKNQPQM